MATLDTAAPLLARDDGRLTRRQQLVLAVLLGSQFMLAVDFSILNVALPVVGRGLGFDLADLQWIASSFALAAAGFTLLFGRVADLFGRRRLFLAGMALLGVSSLVGGLATSPSMLLAARVAQGLATAAVTPAALSLLTTAFHEGPARNRALGLNGAIMSAGFTSGAVLGGVLTDGLSWRWAFFVNVPVAAVVLLVAPRVIAESRPSVRTPLDLPGAATVTAGLLALVYGLTTAGQAGWGDAKALVGLAAAAVLLPTFYRLEARAAAPLVPVHVLRLRSVGWGNLAGLLAFATETSLVFLMTLYLQGVLGYSPLKTGLAFAVLGAGTVLGGSLAPRAIAALGARRSLVVGFAVQAAATAALLLLGTDESWLALLLAATFVGGVGNMLAIVGFMVTATSGLADDVQGLATGLATMTQQVGIALGIPVMSTLLTARLDGGTAGVAPSALLDAVDFAVAANAGAVAIAALLAALFLRSDRAAGPAAHGVGQSA